MTWWCSARGLPWDWSWDAYPGVWVFALVIGALFWQFLPKGSHVPWLRRTAIPSATLLLWITLDWPAGPLGAGYLASVHSAQFLMLAMVIPPLLLYGVDRARVAGALERHATVRRVLSSVTQPLFAIIAFAVSMVVSHLPTVVDSLMRSQVGAFALDLVWLVAGILFWWPIIVRVPERPRFPPLMQMLYLFFGTQPHLYIAMWLLGADFPAYATYELAPRVTALSAMTDQQIAGAVMLAFGGTYVLAAISVLFFKWNASVSAQDAPRVTRNA